MPENRNLQGLREQLALLCDSVYIIQRFLRDTQEAVDVLRIRLDDAIVTTKKMEEAEEDEREQE